MTLTTTFPKIQRAHRCREYLKPSANFANILGEPTSRILANTGCHLNSEISQIYFINSSFHHQITEIKSFKIKDFTSPKRRECFYHPKYTIMNKTTCSLSIEMKMQSFMTETFFTKLF